MLDLFEDKNKPTPTLYERFFEWLYPTPYAAEQRALLNESRRRLQLRNDLLEGLIARRKAKEAEVAERDKRIHKDERLVFTWKYPLTVNHIDCDATCFFFQTKPDSKGKIYRTWKLQDVRTFPDAKHVEYNKSGVTRFLMGVEDFNKYLMPWHHHSLSTEKLKKSKCKNIIWPGDDTSDEFTTNKKVEV